jgi:hypothetical protein
MRRAALPALNRLLPNVGTLKSLNHRVNLLWCQQRGEVAGSQDLANLEVRTEFSKLRQICHRDYSTNIGDWKLASRGGGIEVDEVTAEGRCQDVLRRERADIRGEFGGHIVARGFFSKLLRSIARSTAPKMSRKRKIGLQVSGVFSGRGDLVVPFDPVRSRSLVRASHRRLPSSYRRGGDEDGK